MKKILLKLTRLGTTLVTVNRQAPALHSKLLDSSQLKIDYEMYRGCHQIQDR